MKLLTVVTSIIVCLLPISCSFNDTFNSDLEYVVSNKVNCQIKPKPSEVMVFRSSMPTKSFIELGTVTSLRSNYSGALEKLQQKAAENCADAVIDIREGNVGVMIRLNATAIKFQ
jgi:hypothetical protein